MSEIEHGADCTYCAWASRGDDAFAKGFAHIATAGHDVKFWAQTRIRADLVPRDQLQGRSPMDILK